VSDETTKEAGRPGSPSKDEALDFVWNTVEKIRTGMLTAFSGHRPRGRPMTAVPRREHNAIYFFADTAAHAEADIRRDPRAVLSFSDPRDQTYLSMTGRVALVPDRDLMQELWGLGADVYFPGGPDDPGVVLIAFEPEEAEYWDSPSNPLVLAVRFVQAKIAKERPDLGDNVRVVIA
jgi:general stress protein 26